MMWGREDQTFRERERERERVQNEIKKLINFGVMSNSTMLLVAWYVHCKVFGVSLVRLMCDFVFGFFSYIFSIRLV